MLVHLGDATRLLGVVLSHGEVTMEMERIPKKVRSRVSTAPERVDASEAARRSGSRDCVDQLLAQSDSPASTQRSFSSSSPKIARPLSIRPWDKNNLGAADALACARLSQSEAAEFRLVLALAIYPLELRAGAGQQTEPLPRLAWVRRQGLVTVSN